MLKCKHIERNPWECLSVYRKRTLEWILKKYVSVRGIGVIHFEIAITGEHL